LRQSKDILGKVGDLKGEADVVLQLGNLFLKKRAWDKGMSFFRKAYEIQEEIRDFNAMARALLGMAKCALGLKRTEQGEKLLFQAMDLVEKQRGLVSSPYYRDIFFSAVSLGECYSLCVQLLVEKGEILKALQISERAKARGLLSDLINREASGQIPFSLRKREAELRSRTVFLRNRLSRATGSERDALIAAFDKNEEAYERLLEEIWACAGQNVLPSVPSPGELLSFVKRQKGVVLEYSLGTERSFLFTITPRGASVFSLPPEKKIKTLVNLFRKELRTPAGNCEPIANELGEILLGRALSELGSQPLVFVVPEGVLYGIPFSALRVNGRLLIEKHAFAIWPSVSFAKGNAEAWISPKTERAFVFGDPLYKELRVLDPTLAFGEMSLERLVASRKEAEKVGEIIGAKVFLGREASEGELKRILPQAAYVHLAVHSFIHPEDPRLSALFLSSGPSEDGVFELRELSETRAKLVVLSACRTALGQLAKGEGFLGFGRAFLQAGARDLVVSLWQVNDESTAQIMPLFWKAYWEGQPTALALRKAQLTYLQLARAGKVLLRRQRERASFRAVPRKEVRPDHPYFWAGFVVLGRGNVAR